MVTFHGMAAALTDKEGSIAFFRTVLEMPLSSLASWAPSVIVKSVSFLSQNVQLMPLISWVSAAAFALCVKAAPPIDANKMAAFQIGFFMQYTSLEFYFSQRLKDIISIFFFVNSFYHCKYRRVQN
jgi:hypothetical protein